jgi:hypothetical protein
MEIFNNYFGQVNSRQQPDRIGVLFARHEYQFFNDILINGKPPAIGIEKAVVPKIDPAMDQRKNRVDHDGKQYPANGKYGGKYFGICKIRHYAPPCGKDFCVATELYRTEGLCINRLKEGQ